MYNALVKQHRKGSGFKVQAADKKIRQLAYDGVGHE